MKYLSIDVETTGLNPKEDKIIQFAYVIDDLAFDKPLVTSSFIVRHKTLPLNEWNVVNQLNLMRASLTEGVYIRETTIPSIIEHVYHDVFNSTKMVVAGKNFASFDLRFLKKVGVDADMFHHRVIDPAMWFMHATDKVPPSLETCLKRAGIEETVAHTALSDALQVCKLIRKVFGKEWKI